MSTLGWRKETCSNGHTRSPENLTKHGKCKICVKEHDRKSGWSLNWRAKNRIKVLLTSARERAVEKGLDFDLKESDIIVPEYCPVLGIKLEWGAGRGKGKARDNSVSLDRVDSTKGYVKANVCIISWRANDLKKDGTAEEHLKIAEYMKGENA
jgi:hypothetical protein